MLTKRLLMMLLIVNFEQPTPDSMKVLVKFSGGHYDNPTKRPLDVWTLVWENSIKVGKSCFMHFQNNTICML